MQTYGKQVVMLKIVQDILEYRRRHLQWRRFKVGEGEGILGPKFDCCDHRKLRSPPLTVFWTFLSSPIFAIFMVSTCRHTLTVGWFLGQRGSQLDLRLVIVYHHHHLFGVWNLIQLARCNAATTIDPMPQSQNNRELRKIRLLLHLLRRLPLHCRAFFVQKWKNKTWVVL